MAYLWTLKPSDTQPLVAGSHDVASGYDYVAPSSHASVDASQDEDPTFRLEIIEDYFTDGAGLSGGQHDMSEVVLDEERKVVVRDENQNVKLGCSAIGKQIAAEEVPAQDGAGLSGGQHDMSEEGPVLSKELLDFKALFHDIANLTEVKCLICSEVSANLDLALAHIESVHPFLSLRKTRSNLKLLLVSVV